MAMGCAALAQTGAGGSPGALRIGEYRAKPGGNVVVRVRLFAPAFGLSGVQFDLRYDPAVMTVKVLARDSVRGSAKLLHTRDLAADRMRVMVVGQNREALKEGVLVDLFVNISPRAMPGEYPISAENVTAAYVWGRATELGAGTGKLVVEASAGSPVRLQPEGVLNAASWESGPIAPGEIVTLLGAGIGPAMPDAPTGGAASANTLSGTSVRFDGVVAPLLYASADQINLVVPMGLPGRPTVEVQVFSGIVPIASARIEVAPSAPGVFSTGTNGLGPGAILNEDGTLNSISNPARRGAIAVLYGTGGGRMNPVQFDGQVTGEFLSRPVLPVQVFVAGKSADVLYAGSAPGLIAGILQVNFRIPLEVEPGERVGLELQVGDARGGIGVSVGVQ